MRYSLSEGAYIFTKFNSGSSVTIAIYKASDSSSITLTSNAMAEISTTGVYKWNTSDITTQPTSFIEYLWIATDGTSSQYGKIVLGGYPDTAEEIKENINNSEAKIISTNKGLHLEQDKKQEKLVGKIDALPTILKDDREYLENLTTEYQNNIIQEISKDKEEKEGMINSRIDEINIAQEQTSNKIMGAIENLDTLFSGFNASFEKIKVFIAGIVAAKKNKLKMRK